MVPQRRQDSKTIILNDSVFIKAIDTAASESMESPALRQQRAFSSENNSDYEYYYEQSALGRRKKKSMEHF